MHALGNCCGHSYTISNCSDVRNNMCSIGAGGASSTIGEMAEQQRRTRGRSRDRAPRHSHTAPRETGVTGSVSPISIGAISVAGGLSGSICLFAGNPQLGIFLVLLAGLVILTMVASQRLAPLYLSPVFIPAFSFFAMGVLGATLFRLVQDAPQGGGARVRLTDEQTAATLQILVLAAACVLAGGLLTVALARRIDRPSAAVLRFDVPPAAQAWLLFGAALPLVITVVSSGSALFRRALYIETAVQDSGLAGIAGQLSIAAVIVLGYLLGTMKTLGGKTVSLLLALSYLMVFFGIGSRRLALFPLLFALGYLVAKRSKLSAALFIVSIPVSLYLIRVALYLRGLGSHGVFPYIEALPGLETYAVGWDSILNNVLISFGIIGATAFQQAHISPEVFWISVNPISGEAAGWYVVASNLRINIHTPFAGIGELANTGIGYLVGYCLVAGAILGIFDLQVQRFLRDGVPMLALATVGFTGLFVLYSIQYNLRPATRMLVYAMVAAVAVEVLYRVVLRRRRQGRLPTRGNSRRMRLTRARAS